LDICESTGKAYGKREGEKATDCVMTVDLLVVVKTVFKKLRVLRMEETPILAGLCTSGKIHRNP
jgi:hypothetical protein